MTTEHKPHKHRPLEFAALDDSIAPECPACREYNNEDYWRLVEQLETLRVSVEIIQSERDEAVGKLRSLGLAVVDAMCDQSSTCRAAQHKPWCFGYQPAHGTGGNLSGAESSPASEPKEE